MAVVKQVTVYRCDTCGKEDFWGKKWRHIIVARGKDWGAWEETIHLCSDKCEDEWREKNGKPRG